MVAAAAAAAEDHLHDDLSFLQGHNARIPKVGDVYEQPKAPANLVRAPRGNAFVPRRRDPEPEPLERNSKDGTVEGKDKHVGRTYDWREYEPELYGGVDPFAHCEWPADTEHLDTPEYQALPAICKQEIIWQKILQDGTRQRFFVGPEFQSFFD